MRQKKKQIGDQYRHSSKCPCSNPSLFRLHAELTLTSTPALQASTRCLHQRLRITSGARETNTLNSGVPLDVLITW
jgi:hypothetical protein